MVWSQTKFPSLTHKAEYLAAMVFPNAVQMFSNLITRTMFKSLTDGAQKHTRLMSQISFWTASEWYLSNHACPPYFLHSATEPWHSAHLQIMVTVAPNLWQQEPITNGKCSPYTSNSTHILPNGIGKACKTWTIDREVDQHTEEDIALIIFCF